MDIEVFKNNSSIVDNNDNRQTLSIYLASNGVIPPKIFEHQKDIRDGNGKTVQDYLINNNIDVPEQWKYQDKQIQMTKQIKQYLKKYCKKYNINQQMIESDSSWCDNIDGITFAMYLAYKGIFPPKDFHHDPNIKEKRQNKNIRQILEDQKLPIPNEWYDNVYIQNYQSKPQCVNDAFYGAQSKKQKNINPSKQYEFGWTTAMILAYNGIIPHSQWNHDFNIKNNLGLTVIIILALKQIQCSNDQKLDTKNLYGYTLNGKQYERTIAHELASNGIVPSKEWLHDPQIKDNYQKTVCDYLLMKNIKVPQEWISYKQININDDIKQHLDQYCKIYGIQDKQQIINNPEYQNHNFQNTFAMYLADKGIIAPKEFEHNAVLQDIYGNTVAIYLEKNNIQPPNQWIYDYNYKLKNNYTTAMKIAFYKKIPSSRWNHNPNIQDDYGFTVKDYLLINSMNIPQQWKNNNDNDNKIDNLEKSDILRQLILFCQKFNINKQVIIDCPSWNNNEEQWTFAIYLAYNEKIVPPKEFEHNPTLQNIYGRTVAVYLEKNGINVPQQWQYKPESRLIQKMTTAMRISLYNKIPSQYWYHNPELVDDDQKTVAMYLAQCGFIPPKEWHHDPELQDIEGKTVCDYLRKSNKYVPKEWQTEKFDEEIKTILGKYCKKYNINKETIYNNPGWQENYARETFAMYLSKEKIIPPDQFNHNPIIQTNYGYTVAIYLERNNIPIPDQWKYNAEYMLKEHRTTAMNLAFKNFIPSNYWNHDPQLIDDYYKRTVAMHLAAKGIIPPQQWYHDKYLKDGGGKTVCDYLIQHNIKVPEQWETRKFNIKIENNLNQYCIKHKIDKQTIINDPSWQDYTYNETFAIFLAIKGIIPPEEFKHNPLIVNIDEHNVQYFLKYNSKEIPEYWKVIDRNIVMTEQIQQELQEYCKYYGILNQQLIINNPSYQKNSQTPTFSMWLANRGIIPPKEFEHNCDIKYNYWTVAFYLAAKGIDPPEQWQHQYLLRDEQGYTVGITLAWNGKIPSDYWMHDIDMKVNGISIRSSLLDWCYIYKNNQFIRFTKDNVEQYVQTEMFNDICQVCLEEGEQEFISATCGHKICLKCFKQMIETVINQKQQEQQKLVCPVCRQRLWFVLIE